MKLSEFASLLNLIGSMNGDLNVVVMDEMGRRKTFSKRKFVVDRKRNHLILASDSWILESVVERNKRLRSV